MKNTVISYFTGVLLALSLSASAQNQFQRYISSLPDSVVVSMRAETKAGKLIFDHNSNHRVPSASTIKVPILIELVKSINDGELSWTTSYKLLKTDKVGGAGLLQHAEEGSFYSYEQLAQQMIYISDNTATNIIINKLGMPRVNDFLNSLAMTQTKLQRQMMDFEAIKQGRQNYTSAADMNKLLQLLMGHQLLNETDTQKVLDILKGCKDQSGIPSLIPKNMSIAHKTGTLSYLRGDTGIIFTEGEPVILSIFVEGFNSIEQANKIIATLAHMVYLTIEP